MEKDDKKRGIEETISLEEIAEIVEMYIQEDENIPVYDGYDISVEEEEPNVAPEPQEDLKKKVIKKKPSKLDNSKNQMNNHKEGINHKENINYKEYVNNEESTKKKESTNKTEGINNKEINHKEHKEVNKSKENIYHKEKRDSLENKNKNKNKVSYKSSFDYIKKRYRSVDMIIGIALIAVIFSSGIGISDEIPKFLKLSSWNGISFGDLGVPILVLAFCFMIPTEVEFDLKNKLDFKQIAIKKAEIGAVIFLLGILINLVGSGFSANFRIMGILQFIGIVYLVVSLIYIVFKRFKFKQNVIGIILVIIGTVGTIGYFAFSSKYGYNMKTCLAYFVDSKVLAGHFAGFERYGIISTISAIFAGLIATAGGCFICDRKSSSKDKSIRILIVGMALIIISLILERKCPYNVNIYSPSFVMLATGGFLIVLSGMLLTFDSMRIKELNLISSPLVVFGASPIFLVVINEILINTLFKANVYSVSLATKIPLDKWIIVDLLSEVFGQGSRTVAFIVMYSLLWFAVTLFMYGKRIFIRVK